MGIPLYTSALHIACLNGDLDTVKFLVDQGADLNAKDINGLTPVQIACDNCHMDVVCFMLEILFQKEKENSDRCFKDFNATNHNTAVEVFVELPPAIW